MRFQSILAATASILSLATARIVGIAVPETIQPGGGFNAIIETENYIQTVYDVAIVFGVAPGAGYPGNLGNVMDSFYLGPQQSNVIYNITKWTTLPAGTPMGDATLSASLMSLYGAANGPTLDYFNVSITVGQTTSTNYISSTQP